MATLLEDEAIMTSASSGDMGHKANFLPLIRKPRSHTLPCLRAASCPQLGGNPKGAQERNPGEENLQWSKRHPFLRLPLLSVHFSAFVLQNGAHWQLQRAPQWLLWSFTILFTYKDLWPGASTGSHDLLHQHLVYVSRGPGSSRCCV